MELAASITHASHSTQYRRQLHRQAMAGMWDDPRGPGGGGSLARHAMQQPVDPRETTAAGTKTTLVMEEMTPLAKELPRYLALSLATRLRSLGVEIQPYTTAQYVTGHEGYSEDGTWAPKAELQLARTFDSLDTRTAWADRVVVAPASQEADTRLVQATPDSWNGLEIDERYGGARHCRRGFVFCFLRAVCNEWGLLFVRACGRVCLQQ